MHGSMTFASQGLARRERFGHRVIAIPKAYPDSQLLLERRGVPRHTIESGTFWQLNLYTNDCYGLPDELFLEPEVNWHRQQLGLKGLIAAAGLWIVDSAATITVLQSDLCQQLYRHPALKRSCKTQVETHFKYWYVILSNAVLDFCSSRGLSTLYCPTGRQILTNTRKQIAPDLFLRIYDHAQERYRCSKAMIGAAEYWEIPLQANADRIVHLAPTEAPAIGFDQSPRICLFHDIEENIDTDISPNECESNLRQVLQIEQEFNIDGTFNVVGTMYQRKREIISKFNARHSLGFHSFNHQLDEGEQLQRCRAVDLRVRGYRPARSQIAPELNDYNLALWNFEWFASSSGSLQHTTCKLQNGIVKIPVHFDDYPLFKGTIDYDQWESRVLQLAQMHPVVGLGLHDCYAGMWLPHYPQLLEKLRMIGSFVSADDVCNNLLLQESQGATVA